MASNPSKKDFSFIYEQLDYSELSELRDEINEIIAKKRIGYSFSVNLSFMERDSDTIPRPEIIVRDITEFLEKTYDFTFFDDLKVTLTSIN